MKQWRCESTYFYVNQNEIVQINVYFMDPNANVCSKIIQSFNDGRW